MIMDKLYMSLTKLCFVLNYVWFFSVWEYTFASREYLPPARGDEASR